MATGRVLSKQVDPKRVEKHGVDITPYFILGVNTMGSFNFEIPNDLHKEFKKYAIDKDKDMRDILVEQIKKVVKNGV